MTENELYHFGVKGMKWGVRRNRSLSKGSPKKASSNKSEAQARREKIKKAAKVGIAVAGTALVAYGAYKIYKNKDAIARRAKLGKKYADNIMNTDIPRTEVHRTEVHRTNINRTDIPRTYIY